MFYIALCYQLSHENHTENKSYIMFVMWIMGTYNFVFLSTGAKINVYIAILLLCRLQCAKTAYRQH